MNFRSGLLVLLLASPGALAQKVNIDFDKEFDFSVVKSYKWRIHPAFEKHPELKDRYSTAIQLVLEAGNQEFMKRGFIPDDSGRPDVFVTFYISAETQQELRTFTEFVPGYWPGGWYGWYAPPTWSYSVVDYNLKGLLLLDIVDAATTKLIWRASCSDTIDDFRKRDKNVNKVMKKAIERFPPKKK